MTADNTQPGLEKIGAAVRKAQRLSSLDYIIEFIDSPPEDLVERSSSVLPATSIVENVFEEDPRFIRLKYLGTNAADLGINPFELVEPLRKAFDAVSVEPDIVSSDFTEKTATGLESISGFGCWVGDSEPAPSDKFWALHNMNVPEAWAYSESQSRPSQGQGIIIAQPDTGITDHLELDQAMDEGRWADFLDGGEPIDPLEYSGLMGNPGHGTGTGSVAISRGTVDAATGHSQGEVTGSAPQAMLAPIRCIESVVRFTQSRVARAIEHAVKSGCHIVTMSLGGIWSRALAAAVSNAIEKNLIVLAAAGNCVRFVVWPARYQRCIAVGGSNVHNTTWKGSCRGEAVDISAPAQHVYRASVEKGQSRADTVGAGEGTSFAVALTAGVAALWLAHHGRQKLIDSLGANERLQDRFIRLARQTSTVPDGWDKSEYGAGIINARALLEAGMGTPVSPGLEGLAVAEPGVPLDADQAMAARNLFAELSRDEEVAIEESLFQRHGLELIWLALESKKTQKGLESISAISPSSALSQELAKPENGNVARLVGL